MMRVSGLLSLALALWVLGVQPAAAQPVDYVSLWKGEGNADDSEGTNHGFWTSDGRPISEAYAAGQVGQAFNIIWPSWIEIPHDPSLDVAGSMTVSFWFRTSREQSSTLLLKSGSWSFHLNGTNNGCGFNNPNDSSYPNYLKCIGSLAFNVTGTNGNAGVNTSSFIGRYNYTDGQWHHVVGMFDAATGRVSVYMDGNHIGTSATTISAIKPSANPIQIGGTPLAFIGDIDEVSIHPRAFSQSEIDALAAGTPIGGAPVVDVPGASNEAPLADAGADQTITCTPSSGTDVILDGSLSSDADGDALSYVWSAGGVEIATGANPTVSLAPGTHTIDLVVNDGTADSASDQVVITIVADTEPPVVALNGDAEVTLEVKVDSYEETGATALDECDGAVAVITSGSVDAGTVGDYTLTYTATDAAGNTGSATRLVHVVDTTPPAIASNVVSISLWPPNHTMHLVLSGIAAADLNDGSVAPVIVVSSDEDANGQGDGDTEVDYEVVDNGDGSVDVYVRAERSGKSDGRTYTITVDASDAAGNPAETQTFTATVAKSQGKGKSAKLAALVPDTYGLAAAMPNPFNPNTTIAYQLPEAGAVSLIVYNAMGQQIRVLEQGFRAPGVHQIEWDGRDDSGRAVSSGLYLYRFVSTGLVETRSMTLLK